MELRKDYILERWVVISEGRAKRPREFKKKPIDVDDKICHFCSGNEHLTPPEISRVEEDGKWKIRVIPNKFPFMIEEGFTDIRTDNIFFTYSHAYGKHEVIVETEDHEKQLYDLTHDEIKEVLNMYKSRFNALSKLFETKYVVLFKNHGAEAGTSIVHSHSQITSMAKMPTLIQDKLNAVKKFDSCPYCDIINIEKGSDRRCFENNSFVAFTPYASRFNYEVWLFSKRHCKNINELNDDEMNDLTEIMVKILRKLKELNCSYNFTVFNSPTNEDLHFHIEFLPRMATWAGFEFSTDIVINSINPEQAAEFYRE
ncbi:galactose-1-phosphate uridylyltransferase [Candidatus Woesearchaeota archaeon]|nr:galactose-1-phosphate uridylyltransferase [Candidatus Woesearchaeota archaeon]